MFVTTPLARNLRLIIAVMLFLFGSLNNPVAAQSNYAGKVQRTQLSVSGIPPDLDKFWRRTSYPKVQDALITLKTGIEPASALVGISPSKPIRYRDSVALTEQSNRKYIYSGFIASDSGWVREARLVLERLSSATLRFYLKEIDANAMYGYRISKVYVGTLNNR